MQHQMEIGAAMLLDIEIDSTLMMPEVAPPTFGDATIRGAIQTVHL
jgi:hypothetical protein